MSNTSIEINSDLRSIISTVKVIKRDGSIEPFNLEKVFISISKACKKLCDRNEILSIIEILVGEIKERSEISTLEISDRIERIMISKAISNPKWFEVVKRYELGKIYKDVYGKRSDVEFDPKDLKLTFSAIKILGSRYLIKDPETGRFIETPQMLFRRVSRAIATQEYKYCIQQNNNEDLCKDRVKYWEELFYELLSDQRFLPNSPTLMNAGTKLGILSACFVIPVRDSIVTPDGEGIYDAVRAQAIIFQQGGGTGFDFSELRPEGDIVSTTGGIASGPLSFMRMFDVNTEVIKQGGKRRGANMGVLHVWHADIEKFIDAKSGQLKDVNLQNFNISVGAYDYFIEAVMNGGSIPLINPRKTNLRRDLGNNSKFYAITRARHYLYEDWVQEVIINELESKGGSIWLDETILLTIDEAMIIAQEEKAIVGYVNAKKLFEKIVRNAWDSGDPGLLFIDTINRRHPVWYLGKINATNPCGEQPLLPWESCNLGSINLEKYVEYDEYGKPRIAWQRLAEDIRVIVRFMDNIIDVAKWPLPQLEEAVKRTRKIGIGVMGWHHMLIKLGIPYDSADALYLAYYLAEWIEYNAALASIELARERGAFPAYDPDKYRPTWLSAKPLEELLAIASIDAKPSKFILELLSSRPQIDWNTVEVLRRKYGIRNAALTSIAPTGTISIIANASPSIEPIFAVAFERHVTVGKFIEVDPLFLEYLRKYELDSPELIEEIARRGSISDIPYMPRTIKLLFKGALDIDPKWHVLHQAVWQQWVCAGVSKTVNLRFEATVDDVRNVYLLAWMLGCKGITVYRDKSKAQQVIYVGVKMSQQQVPKERTEKIQLEEKSPQDVSTQQISKQQLFTVTRGKSITEAIEELAVQSCPTCEY
ncbi:ribonucleoside-diphosphate reductase, adenosylcobalamin-dependent [Ignisphaera aggregans DSM 17230]|uniref:Vitamin B12-dependent ribonucleotide reductase n=1 Tax=Ignisphaera aggregans (strain DSM 17230 / JCM 13409 / AQ1.S1) TaxID=583356 RepID=E0SP69_IGNAA|nr:ribonucleoside-diphosphate reductase, adenosylcobalamin-dependent [Ignisphaera aggregans DSM 17230]